MTLDNRNIITKKFIVVTVQRGKWSIPAVEKKKGLLKRLIPKVYCCFIILRDQKLIIKDKQTYTEFHNLKRQWTTSASSPHFFFFFFLFIYLFFFKVEIFIPLEVYIIILTACFILHFNFNNEDMWIFLAVAIFKSLLWKMAATVMAVEFGTIHHFF